MNLDFEINNQVLVRLDTNRTVEYSQKYLVCNFEFKTSDWSGLTIAALFQMKYQDNPVAVYVDDDGKCVFPIGATRANCEVALIGASAEDIEKIMNSESPVGKVITTNPVTINFRNTLDTSNIADLEDPKNDFTVFLAKLQHIIDTVNAHPYTSLQRLQSYLYKITFEKIPEEEPIEPNAYGGGCSSFVKDGKLYRNLDWTYDKSPTFMVECPGFCGTAYSNYLEDTDLKDNILGQLPYHLADGKNDYGIRVSTHVLYNDWDWDNDGEIPMYKIPYIILSTIKSLDDFETQISEILGNLGVPQLLKSEDYLLQFLVTDGTTTYAIMPSLTNNTTYVVEDISSNPKLANFRWVENETVELTDEELQERPNGIERWNLMPCDLKDLRYTLAYESPDRLSEFVGLNGTTKYSDETALMYLYIQGRMEYINRTRNGNTWFTKYSVVYSADKVEEFFSQENFVVNFGDKEDKFNKVTIITDDSTDEQYPSAKAVNDALGTKVSVVEGMDLSHNDYIDVDRQMVENLKRFLSFTLTSIKLLDDKQIIIEDSSGNPILTINSNDITLIKDGKTHRLTTKVDKETGKGLSSNDFTDNEKRILDTFSLFYGQSGNETIKYNGGQITQFNDLAEPIWSLGKGGVYEYDDDGYRAHHLTEKINITDIINNVISDVANQPLSAKMGMELNQRIQNLASIGRYLALWDCIEGIPTSAPPSTPYPYLAGDYFIVSNVVPKNAEAFRTDRVYNVGEFVSYNSGVYRCIVKVSTPGDWNASNWKLVKNYKPDSSQYTTTKSTTEDTVNDVKVGDVYKYDGTVWAYLGSASKDVSFENISGNPTDNDALANVLNNKVGFTDYATSNKGGVIKVTDTYGLQMGGDGSLVGKRINTYADYVTANSSSLISKATLGTVITGSHLDRPAVEKIPAGSNPLRLNTIYDLGEQSSIELFFNSATENDVGLFVQVDFLSGSTATTITINAASSSIVADFDFTPEPNTGYSLYFDCGLLYIDNSYTTPFPVYGWRFGYNEWTHTVGE